MILPESAALLSPTLVGETEPPIGTTPLAVSNQTLAFLNRGPGNLWVRYCYEGTTQPIPGCSKVTLDELTRMCTWSRERERNERWMQHLQASEAGSDGRTSPDRLSEYNALKNPPAWQYSFSLPPQRVAVPQHQPQPQLAEEAKVLTANVSLNVTPVATPAPQTVPPQRTSGSTLSVFPVNAPILIKGKPSEWYHNPVSPPNWGPLYDLLAAAYLKWKMEHPPESRFAIDTPPKIESDSSRYGDLISRIPIIGKNYYIRDFHVPYEPDPSTGVLLLDTRRKQNPNEILLSYGLLSNARMSPCWACSIRLLQEFHLLRIQSRGKYGIPTFLIPLYAKLGRQYSPSERNRFRLTYAVFVGILRTIEQQNAAAEDSEATQLQTPVS